MFTINWNLQYESGEIQHETSLTASLSAVVYPNLSFGNTISLAMIKALKKISHATESWLSCTTPHHFDETIHHNLSSDAKL
jgi:hypothetical protein